MYVPEGYGTVFPYFLVGNMDMPYEDRQGGVTDPFGNIWWISTRLVQEAYD